ITLASCALVFLVMPPAFRALQKFYRDFEKYDGAFQRNFAIKFWLVFFLGLVLLLRGQTIQDPIRVKLIDTLKTQSNVRELTGKNDGLEVEKYLAYVSQPKGAPWCAAFVSWNLNAVGVSAPPNPKTAWSPAFANVKHVIWSASLAKAHRAKTPRPGDVFTLYY